MIKNRVARYDRYGRMSVLTLETEAMPKPGPNEVLVRVVASALNHMDAYVREGRFKDEVPTMFPAGEGKCFAGIVKDVGLEVTRFKAGDEVVGYSPTHSAHADYTVVPVGALVTKPHGVSWEVAGSLYLASTTAMALVDSLPVAAGDTVVISAAAGGTGHIEAQLLKARGVRVLGISGRENHDYLRSIGVKPVNYGFDLERELYKMTRLSGIQGFIDNYGGYESLMDALEVPWAGRRSSDERRALELRFYNATGVEEEPRQLLEQMLELIQQGTVQVLISGFYPFARIEDAYEDLNTRHARGKVIIGMNSVPGSDVRAHDRLREWYQQDADREMVLT